MTVSSPKARINAERSHLKALLERVPTDDWVSRESLEARLGVLESSREQVAGEETQTQAALTFRGRPVHESAAIRSDFSEQILKALNRLFSSVSKQARELLGTADFAPSLMVTGVARGSFGFVVEERGAGSDRSVLKTMSGLVEAAKSDDAFAVALQDSDEEVIKSLGRFVRVLNQNGATVRISGGDGWRAAIDDEEAVTDAVRRLGSITENGEKVVRGVLHGLLFGQRKFEVLPEGGAEMIRGSIPAGVLREHEAAFRTAFGRHGTATLAVRQFEQPWSPNLRATYKLLKFEADP
ncbi:MAG: hypothetical protein Q8L14_00615 [Myxococcales bacterium]|nr:hypothetical protein [Myxococcales bacterium]